MTPEGHDSAMKRQTCPAYSHLPGWGTVPPIWSRRPLQAVAAFLFFESYSATCSSSFATHLFFWSKMATPLRRRSVPKGSATQALPLPPAAPGASAGPPAAPPAAQALPSAMPPAPAAPAAAMPPAPAAPAAAAPPDAQALPPDMPPAPAAPAAAMPPAPAAPAALAATQPSSPATPKPLLLRKRKAPQLSSPQGSGLPEPLHLWIVEYANDASMISTHFEPNEAGYAILLSHAGRRGNDSVLFQAKEHLTQFLQTLDATEPLTLWDLVRALARTVACQHSGRTRHAGLDLRKRTRMADCVVHGRRPRAAAVWLGAYPQLRHMAHGEHAS